MNNWFTFLIAILTTYRLSLMLSSEEGPAAIFARMRRKVPAKTNPGRGIRCFFCWSIWIGALVTSFIWWRNDDVSWIDAPFYALALSAGAIILNQAFTKGGK